VKILLAAGTCKLSLVQKEISDDTQRNWIVPALEAVAVDSSKAVHAMRQSVARLADIPSSDGAGIRLMSLTRS
jgi:hypothetical protein